MIGPVVVLTAGMQGPPGAPGATGPAAADPVFTAGVAIGGNRLVYLDDAGLLQYATNTDIALVWRLLGMTTGAISAGAEGPVRLSGEVTEPSWSLTPGAPVYLGDSGLITQLVPALPGSKFLQVIGVALTSTSIVLEKRDPIQL